MSMHDQWTRQADNRHKSRHKTVVRVQTCRVCNTTLLNIETRQGETLLLRAQHAISAFPMLQGIAHVQGSIERASAEAHGEFWHPKQETYHYY